MTETHVPLILLVEDNPDDELLMRHALGKSEVLHAVESVRDGTEALERLLGPGAEAAPVPALVLLDIRLPKVDGLEVLRRLRDDPRTSMLPVIVVTTSRSEQDVRACYELGANGCVMKTIDFTEFCDAMRTLALYWLRINQPPPVYEP